MQRFFTASLVALALVIGATGAASIAHAMDFSCTDLTATPVTALPVGTSCTQSSVPGKCDAAGICQPSSVAPGTIVPDKPTDYHPDSTDSIFATAIQKIMTLFAWLVGVAAITLDNAVYYTVVTMGTYIHNLSAVGTTWRILRDVGNIMLIFGFLAIGITTVLNVDWYGGGKKMIPMLIVAAVFLNFSLFMSEAVIDSGNLFATQFYTQINGGLPAAPLEFNSTTIHNEGISNKIMGQLGLQTLYGNAKNPDLFKDNNPLLIGFMGILLFIVTAFVLFSLAFILIARFVALVFIIILSPIGFAGLAIPQLARRAGQWWELLFHQTLTAPILLLMLYIALAVITDASFLTGFGASGGASAATGFIGNSNLPGFASYILSFIVAMGLLIAVTIQAKNLSAFGASWATQTAGKLTFGLTAAGMRSTAGWGLQRASQGFKKMGLARVPVVGRAVSGVLDRGAKASFDVRGATLGGGLKGIGVEAGAAQKGGFREWEKGKIKEREEYAKTLAGRGRTYAEEQQIKTTEGNRAYAETLYKEADSKQKTAVAERDKQKAEVERLAAIDKADRDAGRPSTVGNALREAQQKLATSEANLAPATAKLAEASEAFEVAKSAEAKATVEVETATSAKAAQEAYAEGLNVYIDQKKGGFLRGAVNFMNPQRNSKAAENIRKEAKKSKADKDLEKIKKFLEESEKPKETPKPEAPNA